ncbi:ETC complex I subunit [Rickettsiales endosymbiont of Stachyamoeba lipophora]|uniref:ETC complex I subunit n=1 Tax=Rickettsiales endosymbiont of Stachyamoeba lipophora TaxID=2486578 RepID=UPI000F648CD4|nr:ETC complex I subunit [Rickettsiales endosymbiont of Stachyamoeba lipophora]AZL15182.1 NADH-ubiquinone oxidoreductase [Rickettsiales endosymbiont of Stachyamoeba lipophora]
MHAKIYRPTKTAMQSGKANTRKWILEFEQDGGRFVEGLMGWTGSTDTLQQIKLYFSTKEQAINYAKKYLPQAEIIEASL